jgi:hypothetical protein
MRSAGVDRAHFYVIAFYLTILFGLLLDRFLFGLIEKRIRRRWGLIAST